MSFLPSVHIIERLREAGLTIDSVVVCGGLTQNSLYLTALANGTGANVMAAEGENAMCLGEHRARGLRTVQILKWI